jgi:hypothetical protein
MKKIILMTAMALGLSGGAAMADGSHKREPVRVETVHYRNARERPAVRFERHDERRGSTWVGGEWRWGHGEWNWVPGHYSRR